MRQAGGDAGRRSAHRHGVNGEGVGDTELKQDEKLKAEDLKLKVRSMDS